jgi:hypothetical protein
MTSEGVHRAGQNKLLSLLPPSTYRRIEGALDKVS